MFKMRMYRVLPLAVLGVLALHLMGVFGSVKADYPVNPYIVRTLNGLMGYLTITGATGTEVSSPDTATIVVSGGPPGGNSLDMAYDRGGPGQGRIINADAGPVHVAGPGGVVVEGNVGIGTTHPTSKLQVVGETTTTTLYASQHATIGQLWAQGDGYVQGETRTDSLTVAGAVDAANLNVSGTTTTTEVVITGGSDIAEPVGIGPGGRIPAGSIVIADSDVPGNVRLSDCPYDRRVLGVISGAGGLNPGLTLTQVAPSNSALLAITGRVYVLADARGGAITPGDFLTTSDTPGHGMKATDLDRARGAIIGKAMSSLSGGHGLVLVLVSLQ